MRKNPQQQPEDNLFYMPGQCPGIHGASRPEIFLCFFDPALLEEELNGPTNPVRKDPDGP